MILIEKLEVRAACEARCETGVKRHLSMLRFSGSQRLHYSDPRQHSRAVMFGDQHQGLDCRLPFDRGAAGLDRETDASVRYLAQADVHPD